MIERGYFGRIRFILEGPVREVKRVGLGEVCWRTADLDPPERVFAPRQEIVSEVV